MPTDGRVITSLPPAAAVAGAAATAGAAAASEAAAASAIAAAVAAADSAEEAAWKGRSGRLSGAQLPRSQKIEFAFAM